MDIHQFEKHIDKLVVFKMTRVVVLFWFDLFGLFVWLVGFVLFLETRFLCVAMEPVLELAL